MALGVFFRILSDLHFILGTRLPGPWDFCHINADPSTRVLINSGSYTIVYFAFLYWFASLITKKLGILGGCKIKKGDFWVANILSTVTASQVLWPLMLIFTYSLSFSFYPWITTLLVLYLYTPCRSYWSSVLQLFQTSAELLRTSLSHLRISVDGILPIISTPSEIPRSRGRSSSEPAVSDVDRILPVTSTPREIPRSTDQSPSESAASGVARIFPITFTPRRMPRFRGRSSPESAASGAGRKLFFQPSFPEISPISGIGRERVIETSFYNPVYRQKGGPARNIHRIEVINDERKGSIEAMPFTEESEEFSSADFLENTADSPSVDTRFLLIVNSLIARSWIDMMRENRLFGRFWRVNNLPLTDSTSDIMDIPREGNNENIIPVNN